MTTLGIRPAPQLRDLRPEDSFISLRSFKTIRSTNYELQATFKELSGNEKFIFNVRESPNSAEVTEIVFDLLRSSIVVNRSHSSLDKLGTDTFESGQFRLCAEEELRVRIFVDESIIEVFANDRFSLSSRIYPSLDTSTGASYNFGGFDERNVEFEYWEGLKNEWPRRSANQIIMEDMPQLKDVEDQMPKIDSGDSIRQPMVYA